MKTIIILVALLLTQSCVSGLNSNQSRKLNAIKMQMPEYYEEEKIPAVAGVLGFLPGGGSFYTRHYVKGVVNLLFWPFSVLWDPINGINGAQELNYYASKTAINRQKNRELQVIEENLAHDKITHKQFSIKSLQVERKYNLDNML